MHTFEYILFIFQCTQSFTPICERGRQQIVWGTNISDLAPGLNPSALLYSGTQPYTRSKRKLSVTHETSIKTWEFDEHVFAWIWWMVWSTCIRMHCPIIFHHTISDSRCASYKWWLKPTQRIISCDKQCNNYAASTDKSEDNKQVQRQEKKEEQTSIPSGVILRHVLLLPFFELVTGTTNKSKTLTTN